MSFQIYRSASRAVRSLVSASKASPLFFEGRGLAAATTTALRGNFSSLSSFYERAERNSASQGWIAGAMAIPAAGTLVLPVKRKLPAAELLGDAKKILLSTSGEGYSSIRSDVEGSSLATSDNSRVTLTSLATLGGNHSVLRTFARRRWRNSAENQNLSIVGSS